MRKMLSPEKTAGLTACCGWLFGVCEVNQCFYSSKESREGLLETDYAVASRSICYHLLPLVLVLICVSLKSFQDDTKTALIPLLQEHNNSRHDFE